MKRENRYIVIKREEVKLLNSGDQLTLNAILWRIRESRQQRGKKEMTPLLCRIGIHRPLKSHHHDFIDRVSGSTVFDATCPCGKMWMVDSPFGWFGFKVEKGKVK